MQSLVQKTQSKLSRGHLVHNLSGVIHPSLKRACRGFLAATLLVAATALLASPLQAQTTVAGVTDGALAVGPDGSASYSVPIKMPPGIAGMAPSLSINYASSGGNGMMGLGWSVGGLSAVHRCTKTLAQDGEVGGVLLDADDRFCLDGSRLVAVSGAYGADGTEYRTEIESFTKIASYGSAGSGPATFKAWTKSGQIIEYGFTSDSQIESSVQPEIIAWAANKISDTAGNYLTVSYLEDVAAGSHYIDRIDYAGNAAAGVSTQSSVRFGYENRPDTSSGYLVGAPTTLDQRLTNIQSFLGQSLVRDYRIDHDNDGIEGQSRVTSVTECNSANSCFAPIVFSYAANGSLQFAKTDDPVHPTAIDENKQIHFGDWNADGLTDFMWFDSYLGLNRWFINEGNSSLQFTRTDDPISPLSINESGTLYFGDWNADGITDVMWMHPTNGANRWFINDGALQFTQTADPIARTLINGSGGSLYFSDWNGDGITDFMWHRSGHGYNRWFLNDGNLQFTTVTDPLPIGTLNAVQGQFHFGDWNGDGITDALWFRPDSGYNRWYLNDGSLNFTTTVNPIAQAEIDGNGELHVGDWNADGTSDVMWFLPSNGMNWWYTNDGTYQFTPTDDPIVRTSINGSGALQFNDWNDDGITDVLWFRTGHGYNRWFTSNGNLQFSETADPIPIASLNESGGQMHAGDWNGDGISDVMWFRPSHGYNRWYTNQLATPDLLESVTDSLGTQTSLSYNPATDDSVYTKGTGAAFPVQDIQGPLYVVSEVSSDDGVGGQARTSYAYEEARVHVQGRGFLGFERMHVTNDLTGITITTEYRQDYPFTGLVSFTETYLDDGTTLKSATNSYASTDLNGGLTVFPHLTQAVGEGYEINDGPGNQPITTVTTINSYDGFGNVTQLVVETSGGGETFKTTTDSTYTNDTANWILGRVTRSDVTQQLPDLTTASRAAAFAYDAATGLLTREVVEPDLATFKLTTDYTRDAFGNILTTTVSGAGIASRTTTTAYSTDGRFPETTTNALGHSATSTSVFDPATGTVLSQTGPNGITTSWIHDGFARKIRENRADGTATLWDYELCTTQCPEGGVSLLRTKDIIAATGAVIGTVDLGYSDALGRVFLTETEGFDGTAVYSDTQFNNRGEVFKVSQPYFAGTPAAEIQWTTTSRDIIGRALSIVTPDGGAANTVYNGLTTTTTNALGQNATRTKNAIGQLVQASDAAGTTVTYTYDHHGNLIETNAAGVVTTMDYDIRGRKISMDDPDMGVWTYDYNVLGELVGQTDAKLQSVTMAYDKLGRMTSRTEPEGTTTWTYDNAAKTAAIGKPDTVSRTQDDYAEDYAYDALGRSSSTTVTYETKNYVSSSTYDAAGRVDTATYPSSFAVQNGYNAFGYLEEVREFGGIGTVYWRAVDVDAQSRVIEELLGNGLTTFREYDRAAGTLDKIQTFQGLTALQDLAFEFDLLGNLSKREDPRQDRAETFAYDNLNRLTGATVTDTLTQTQLGQTSYAYDALGNLTSKSDVGAYTYGGAAGPHAVTTAGGKTYAYDANGSMTSTAQGGSTTRSVSWSSFNKPVHVTDHSSTNVSDLVYGPDRDRIKQTTTKAGGTTTLTYLGAYETETKAGAADKLKHYISAGGTVAIYTKVDDGLPATDKTRYLHRDHLGSLDLITDEAGNVAERRSHDPHGLLRQTDWQAAASPIAMLETLRGFTGHEHLDSVGLIHMNGRVYDPVLGRFLSADPFVQAPETAQSFNRYSYVNNNPLSLTDPSGFFWGKIVDKVQDLSRKLRNEDLHRAIMGLGERIRLLKNKITPGFVQRDTEELLRNKYVQIAGSAIASYYGGPMGAAIFAAAVAEAYGGDFEDMARAAGRTAAMAYAAQGIGAAGVAAERAGASATTVFVAKTVAHGVASGAYSLSRGGSFRAGFVAGALGQIAAQGNTLIDGRNFAAAMARTAVSAVAGGVGAELGGGKFQNGAVTAAFSYLASGAELRRLQPTASQGQGGIAFVGGAADGTIEGAAYKAYQAYLSANPGTDAAYFTWDQGDALQTWIEANGPSVTVIGHSYGGDTAVGIVAAGSPVDVLISVDPVGWFRPDFSAVAGNAGAWINYNATGGQGTFPNFLAGIGGAYNSSPASSATRFQNIPLDHASTMCAVAPAGC